MTQPTTPATTPGTGSDGAEPALASQGREPQYGLRRPSRIVVAALAILVVVAGVSGFSAWRKGSQSTNPGASVQSSEADFDYVIPAGTAERLLSGDALDVMPDVLRMKVGQVIRIRNDDAYAADVGPFRVPARSTITQRMTRKGTYLGYCVLSPSGKSELIVS